MNLGHLLLLETGVLPQESRRQFSARLFIVATSGNVDGIMKEKREEDRPAGVARKRA